MTYFKPGDRVKVIRGSLSPTTGVVLEVDKEAIPLTDLTYLVAIDVKNHWSGKLIVDYWYGEYDIVAPDPLPITFTELVEGYSIS